MQLVDLNLGLVVSPFFRQSSHADGGFLHNSATSDQFMNLTVKCFDDLLHFVLQVSPFFADTVCRTISNRKS